MCQNKLDCISPLKSLQNTKLLLISVKAKILYFIDKEIFLKLFTRKIRVKLVNPKINEPS
jgi:hypothetical protein